MFEGKKVLLSGGSDGIGAQLAMDLAQRGATIAFCGRDTQKIARVQGELSNISEGHMGSCVDLSISGAAAQWASEVLNKLGQVDILINNAGMMALSPIRKVEVEQWRNMATVNFNAPMELIGTVLPNMLERKEGDIINVSSISARITGPGVTVYSATKQALDGFTEGIRRELVGSGVRVASIQLGGVRTDINEKISDSEMRRLISMRSKGYHSLSIPQVTEQVIHMLSLPRECHLASVFFVSSDQAS